jgi:hypothetical protein
MMRGCGMEKGEASGEVLEGLEERGYLGLAPGSGTQRRGVVPCDMWRGAYRAFPTCSQFRPVLK